MAVARWHPGTGYDGSVDLRLNLGRAATLLFEERGEARRRLDEQRARRSMLGGKPRSDRGGDRRAVLGPSP
jgi:hypothetical protein